MSRVTRNVTTEVPKRRDNILDNTPESPESPIRERIREIAAEKGGPSILAREAGLATSTVNQYLSTVEGRAREPGVTALIKLARAANVSIEWLATGEGRKAAGDAPEGYVAIGYIDLSQTGTHLRSVLAHFDHPPELLLLRRRDITGRAIIGGKVMALGGSDDLAFEPEVLRGDIILVERPRGHEVAGITFVSGWEFQEDDIQLVADGTSLKLRRFRRLKDSVQVITAQGKVERVLTGAPIDFIFFGRVVWRSGVLPGARKPISTA